MTNAKFPKECGLVCHLMGRLDIAVTEYIDPNECGSETGVDVIASTNDKKIGIQVTDLDTGSTPGIMRSQEVRFANQLNREGHESYGFWAQNDSDALVAAITRAIERKVDIAAKHDFKYLDEVWLLVACGVPMPVGTVSTMLMTPWIPPEALNSATETILTNSKYDRIFVFAIMGVEEKALYQWDVDNGWRKDALIPDPRTMGPSVFDVLKDPDWLNNPDERCEREVRQVLREFQGETGETEGGEQWMLP